MRLEDHREVSRLVRGAVREGLQAHEHDARVLELARRDARVQDRMHLRDVRAPGEDHVGQVEVVVAAHRLVHAEGRVEAGDGRGHAEAGIALEVVRAEPALQQLVDRVALEDRGLAREVGGHGLGAVRTDRVLDLACGEVERGVPGDRHEPLAFPEQRCGEPVASVEDLRQAVALDAEEPPVHGVLRVAAHRDDPSPAHADQHAAARAAEAARGLLPAIDRRLGLGLGRDEEVRADRGRDAGGDGRPDELPAMDLHRSTLLH